MLGIGFGEMILIAGLALVVIGPEKFPDFAKLVIRTVRDLRGYVDDVKSEMTRELTPIKKEMEALSRIDPEKYIDSLTAEAETARTTPPSNPSINEEDRKVMSAAEADAYDDDPYGWKEGQDNPYGADKGAYPEQTVGYGSEGHAVEAADDSAAGGDETQGEVTQGEVTQGEVTQGDEGGGDEVGGDEVGGDTQSEAPKPALPEDNRIEAYDPDASDDVWTSR